MQKRNVEAHETVEDSRPENDGPEELHRRPEKERRHAPAGPALEPVLRAEPRVRRRLPKRVREVAVGVMDERRHEPFRVPVDHQDLVYAAAFGPKASRPTREAQLVIRIPGAVAYGATEKMRQPRHPVAGDLGIVPLERGEDLAAKVRRDPFVRVEHENPVVTG